VGAVEQHDLYDASNVVVCTKCDPDYPDRNVSLDGGSTYTKSFDAGDSSLLNDVGARSGWFITLPKTRERNLTTAAVIGGTMFFTTFFPGGDVCTASAEGRLYALYYKTGTPYKESTIGESPSGTQTVANKFIALGAGVPSGVSIHIGAKGTGAAGTQGEGQGSVGGCTLLNQMSTGAISETACNVGLVWSRMLAWRDV
jgi:Tfp pilus tip-associated adhesin PilY1